MLTVATFSIIIGNFTSKTGSALLTQPQREWIDLQKLIKLWHDEHKRLGYE